MSWDEVREKLSDVQPTVDDEWLRHLHSSYVDRFLSDNQRIWATAAILVPVSLAAFPAFFATEGRGLWKALAFAIFSITIMTFWHFIAKRHRYFQEQAYNIAQFIEAFVLGADVAKGIRAAARMDVRNPRPSVRSARLGLLVGTVALWLLVAILAGLGLFPEAQSPRP